MARSAHPERWASPAEARILARALLFAGSLSLFTAAVPFSPTAPRHLAAVMGVAGLLLGALLHQRRDRLQHQVPHAVLVLATVVVSASVAASTTPAGRVVTACGYIWITLFTATFHSRSAMAAHTALAMAGFAAALGFGGAPSPLQTWIFMGGTVAAVAWTVNGLVQRLRRHADHDQLTGALTRAAWFDQAELALARAARTGQPLTLAIVDLDDFKTVNDRDGHAAGDRLLTGLVRAWSGALAPCQLLGRYGGDEFVLLLPATTAEGAHDVLARLRAAAPLTGWSAGVAELARGEDVDTWLARADAAMYSYKRERPVRRR